MKHYLLFILLGFDGMPLGGVVLDRGGVIEVNKMAKQQ